MTPTPLPPFSDPPAVRSIPGASPNCHSVRLRISCGMALERIAWVPRGFSRARREFSVLAEGRHIFGRRPKPRAAKRAGHYDDLTETGNRARKVSGTQGIERTN